MDLDQPFSFRFDLLIVWCVVFLLIFLLGAWTGKASEPGPKRIHVPVPCPVPVYLTHAQSYEQGEAEEAAKIQAMRECSRRLREKEHEQD